MPSGGWKKAFPSGRACCSRCARSLRHRRRGGCWINVAAPVCFPEPPLGCRVRALTSDARICGGGGGSGAGRSRLMPDGMPLDVCTAGLPSGIPLISRMVAPPTPCAYQSFLRTLGIISFSPSMDLATSESVVYRVLHGHAAGTLSPLVRIAFCFPDLVRNSCPGPLAPEAMHECAGLGRGYSLSRSANSA